MSERKNVLKLNTKVHSVAGIIGFVLSIISLVLLVCAITVSVIGERSSINVQYSIGVLEIYAFLCALVGICISLLAETIIESLKKFAHLGVIINSLVLVIHAIIIFNGYNSL